MSGLDIFVIIMGVIAGGVGISCFVAEKIGENKKEKEHVELKEGESK